MYFGQEYLERWGWWRGGVDEQEGLRRRQLEVVDAHAAQDTVPPLQEEAHVQHGRLGEAHPDLCGGDVDVDVGVGAGDSGGVSGGASGGVVGVGALRRWQHSSWRWLKLGNAVFEVWHSLLPVFEAVGLLGRDTDLPGTWWVYWAIIFALLLSGFREGWRAKALRAAGACGRGCCQP